MRRYFLIAPALIVAGWLLIGTGCESGGGGGEMTADEGSKGGPPFGGEADVKRAKNLWKRSLGGKYTKWASYPGLDGWQPGKSPHGKVLRYFINGAAARNPANPGNGSIIVKENYGQENGPLMAVTIMQKIKGYDPDNADWFWVKYGPNGEILKNPKGMMLAGRVAKGMPAGCIACHGNAGGGDYLFIND